MKRGITALSCLLALSLGCLPCAKADTSIERDPVSGRIVALKPAVVSKAGSAPALKSAGALAAQHRQLADSFLAEHQKILGLKDSASELSATSTKTDELGMSHIAYDQFYRGVPVFGAQIVVHVRGDEVVFVSAGLADKLPAELSPALSRLTARRKALAAAKKEAGRKVRLSLRPARLTLLPLGLLHNTAEGETVPAWIINVYDQARKHVYSTTFFIDAASGKVALKLANRDRLNRFSYDCGIAPGNGNCYLDHYSATYDYYFGRSESAPERGPSPTKFYATPTPNGIPTASTDVDKLHHLLGQAHAYVQTSFGLDGANNMGGAAVGTGGVPVEYTRGYTHWENTGAAMCPGGAEFMHNTGDMHFCLQMAAPDTVGHEYAHAVVFHSYLNYLGNPIGIISYGQTGSLSEGHAEFSGEAFEHFSTGATDWKAGTDSAWSTLFDLSDPGATGYIPPGQVTPVPNPERWHSRYVVCDPDFDDFGAHINGSIISHMLYRMANGGGQNGCYIEAIGIEAVKQIFFRLWRNHYLTRTASFAQAYNAFQQGCSDLYDAHTCEQVRIALEASELDEPGYCGIQPEEPPDCPFQDLSEASTYITDWATGEVLPVDDYVIGENVLVRGCGGTEGRSLTLTWRVQYSSPIPIGYEWWKIKGTYGAQYTVTVTFGPDGCFEAFMPRPLERYSNYLNFGIYIDVDNDTRWQPWSDYVISYIPLLSNVVHGDGICRSVGQFQSTSEDCHSSPLDCACPARKVCAPRTQDPEGAYHCVRPSKPEQYVPHMVPEPER